MDLETVNSWLAHWEPIWLLLVLLFEAFVGLFSALVLLKEYFYDMEFNENIKRARKERRRKKYEFHLPEEKLVTGEMQ